VIHMEPLREADLVSWDPLLARWKPMSLRHDPSHPHTASPDAPRVVYGLRSPPKRAGQTRQLIHAAIWLAGAAGFLVPLILARTSPHADLLRAFALGWFILFGVINGVFVLRTAPRRRFRRTLDR
jgi:hypothetical protein